LERERKEKEEQNGEEAANLASGWVERESTKGWGIDTQDKKLIRREIKSNQGGSGEDPALENREKPLVEKDWPLIS